MILITNKYKRFILIVLIALPLKIFSQTISGELKKWHKITINFTGPVCSEMDDPNPFLDYRLDVIFKGPNGQVYKVPGYFAADGNAANSSAIKGNQWMVHFAPDQIGKWTWSASFRKGQNIAVDSIIEAGNSAGYFDGSNGVINIAPSDKTGRDFRAKGRLNYVGEHYLQFSDTKEYMIKFGSDIPENLFAYTDFDGTPNVKQFKRSYSPHIKDWKENDPLWQNTKGKGLIGAINYLASEGLNSMSFLTFNVDGDDRNVFPYLLKVSEDEYVSYANVLKNDRAWDSFFYKTRFDVSKLAQWEIIIEYMQQQGMFAHFKTQETENEMHLDNGNTETERKLYYRELIARFGHNLALNWNLGEENGSGGQATDQNAKQRQDMAAYFYKSDPYHHPIVIHNGKPPTDLIGEQSKLTGYSYQGHDLVFNDLHPDIKKWVIDSRNSGRKWTVACDEQGKGHTGITSDTVMNNNQNMARDKALWGTVLAGGWGCEWFSGTNTADLKIDDFRSYDKWWDYSRYALRFFKLANLPLIEMESKDELISVPGYCFAKKRDVYVVYLNNASSATIDLSGTSDSFTLKWFDPRNGGDLQTGTIAKIKGGAAYSIGNPPNSAANDWVILIKKDMIP